MRGITKIQAILVHPAQQDTIAAQEVQALRKTHVKQDIIVQQGVVQVASKIPQEMAVLRIQQQRMNVLHAMGVIN